MEHINFQLLQLHLHDKHDLDKNPKHYHQFTPYLLDPKDPRVADPDLVLPDSEMFPCPVQGFLALPDPQDGGYPVRDRYLLFGSTKKENLDKFQKAVTEALLTGKKYGWSNPEGKSDYGHFTAEQVQAARTGWGDRKAPWCKEFGAGPRIPPAGLNTPASGSKSTSRSPSTSRR